MTEISLSPILHLVVVGFHHKKGGQVEYAYPPFSGDQSVDNVDVPEKWKNLPSLALPDGAHNFKRDTIFFHLPSLNDSCATVFGVSCYHQIDSESVVNKSADITRNSVQKSVCVLSTMPLYGLIASRLDMITQAWFEEKNFSDVSILEETYRQLCSSCATSEAFSSHIFLGLSARELVLNFRHNVLALFKLLLLERRIVLFGQPAGPVSNALVTLVSLLPDVLEAGGLAECTCYGSARLVSPTLKNVLTESGSDEGFLEVTYSTDEAAQQDWGTQHVHFTTEGPVTNDSDGPSNSTANQRNAQPPTQLLDPGGSGGGGAGGELSHGPVTTALKTTGTIALPTSAQNPLVTGHTPTDFSTVASPTSAAVMEELLEREDTPEWDGGSPAGHLELQTEEAGQAGEEAAQAGEEDSKGTLTALATDLGDAGVKALSGIKSRLSNMWDRISPDRDEVVSPDPDPDQPTVHQLAQHEERSAAVCLKCQATHTSLTVDDCGFPLALFTKGYICHPYLSLQYFDLLTDVNVRGFVLAASNMLFKQKRHLVEVLIEPLTCSIDFRDDSLRSLVQMTTADLRFADYIVKQVDVDKGNEMFNDTEWEGGEEWIRNQFKLYTASLLTTASKGDSKLKEDFGAAFIRTFQTTTVYREWSRVERPGLKEAPPGHPCHGQTGINDVKMKFSHVMHSSERGKKLLAAADTTGRAAARTGKVLGGAIQTARSAVSSTVNSWFSSVRKWSVTGEEEEGEGKKEEEENKEEASPHQRPQEEK